MSAHSTDYKRLVQAVIIAIALVVVMAAIVIRLAERSSRHQTAWEDRALPPQLTLDKPPGVSEN